MHFYMAGIDQQVGAVPSIAIALDRWYTTCFTWDNTGRWRGYRDGEEITNNKTGSNLLLDVHRRNALSAAILTHFVINITN